MVFVFEPYWTIFTSSGLKRRLPWEPAPIRPVLLAHPMSLMNANVTPPPMKISGTRPIW
jgi:hypothetical protein